jgi:hypothetical protein
MKGKETTIALLCLAGVVLVLGINTANPVQAEEVGAGRAKTASALESLPELCDFEMQRITSADPTGGNKDWRELQPGQILVLAEIKGPGSEDYFCESYGLRAGAFPYYGVTINEEPFATAYRWHVPDPVPFKRSIRFLIEHGRGDPPFRSGNFYYSVAYWYQAEPHAPFPEMPSVGERTSWARQARK